MAVPDSPILVYTAVVVGVILLVAQAIPKVLGPIGTGLADWARHRRESRIESADADMADVQRQVAYLTQMRDQDRAEHAREKAEMKAELAEHRRVWAARERRWRQEWQAHRQWDFKAQEALLGRVPPIGLAPPFMTPDPSPNPFQEDE